MFCAEGGHLWATVAGRGGWFHGYGQFAFGRHRKHYIGGAAAATTCATAVRARVLWGRCR